MTDAMLVINGATGKEAIDATADAIVKVATCSPIPKVAIAALAAFQHVAKVENVTVTNCTFTNQPTPAHSIPVVGSNCDLEV